MFPLLRYISDVFSCLKVWRVRIGLQRGPRHHCIEEGRISDIGLHRRHATTRRGAGSAIRFS